MQEAAEGYEVFVAVVEAGSISAAARGLGTPRETLSRRLSRLEERLGVRLLHRQSRSLVVTPAGQALYDRARPLVAAAQEAEAAIRRLDGVPRGLLRVSMPPSSPDLPLSEFIFSFLKEHPEVQLELDTTARHVDLIGEGLDVALRAGVTTDPRLYARTLLHVRLVAVASPAYLARHGHPTTAADLAGHQLILGMQNGHSVPRSWPTLDGAGVPVRGRLCTNDIEVLQGAALAGHGIALLPDLKIKNALSTGALEVLLPDIVGAASSLSVVYVERKLMPPKVRAFVDHVVHWFDPKGPGAMGR